MIFSIRFHGIRRRVARILAVARVETLHLIHDRTTFSLILLVPAVQIVLFGYAVNFDPRHIPIVIARDQQGPGTRLSARSAKQVISRSWRMD